MEIEERSLQLVEEYGKDMKVTMIKMLREEFGVDLLTGKKHIENAIAQYEKEKEKLKPTNVTVKQTFSEAEKQQAINNASFSNKPTYKNTLLGTVALTYKGGHPSLTKEKDCTVKVFSNSLEISYGFSKGIVKMQNVTNCQIESQDQIERRITATRILALGVFALAFKKKKKKTDKYLTIDYTDDNGISNVILLEGKASLKAHSLIYEAMKGYARQNNTQQIEVVSQEQALVITQHDPYEEVKKAKELLDMGILTQEEFDQKKKELLNL